MRTYIQRALFVLLLSITTLSLGQTIVAPQEPVNAPGTPEVKFNHFKELQAEILNLIGSAKSRVVLITDFLTDGEISSSLYLAKYRKIDVKVYLGEQKVNQYLSRVNFLQQQGIEVSLRKQLPFREPTLLLIDQQLFRVTRDLDVLRPDIAGQLVLGSPKLANLLVESLSNPGNNVKIYSRPYPQVGRARSYSNQNTWSKPYTGNADGSYNYDNTKNYGRPSDVPAALPKVPKYQVGVGQPRIPTPEKTSDSKPIVEAPSPEKENTETEDRILLTPDNDEGNLDQPFLEDN